MVVVGFSSCHDVVDKVKFYYYILRVNRRVKCPITFSLGPVSMVMSEAGILRWKEWLIASAANSCTTSPSRRNYRLPCAIFCRLKESMIRFSDEKQ